MIIVTLKDGRQQVFKNNLEIEFGKESITVTINFLFVARMTYFGKDEIESIKGVDNVNQNSN